ncbi:MAG: dual specificity protein phosphatase family protein [Ignavibacteria bacterium]
MHTQMSELKTKSPLFYEVIPGLLYAGVCPWESSVQDSHVSDLLSMEIRDFITLKEDVNVHESIATLMNSLSDINILHVPIEDYSLPQVQALEHILTVLHKQVQSHKKTYVSCAKGLGRTGVVISCFLAEFHDISGSEAMNLLNQKRLKSGFMPTCDSPETHEQIEFVQYWKKTQCNS